MAIPITWILMRATGIVALMLLTLDVTLGVLGPRLRPATRLTTISLHVAAGVTGSLLLAGHIAFAVIDPYVNVSALAVVLPGASAWQPLWIGVGTLALDLLLLVLISSAMRHRAPATWRRWHLLTYPMWALAWGHAVMVGTDDTLMLTLAVASGLLVAAAAVARFRGSRAAGRSWGWQPQGAPARATTTDTGTNPGNTTPGTTDPADQLTMTGARR